METKAYCVVDADGYFIGSVEPEIPPRKMVTSDGNGNYIINTEDSVTGFYQPRFNFDTGKWVEGLTEEKIAQIKAEKQPMTESESIRKDVKQVQEALTFLFEQMSM